MRCYLCVQASASTRVTGPDPLCETCAKEIGREISEVPKGAWFAAYPVVQETELVFVPSGSEPDGA